MFTWRPLIKIPQKFTTVHTATHNWYYIFLIWQVFSPRKKIVNWFDQRKVPKFGDAPWTWHSSNEATVPSTTPIYRRFVLSPVSLALIKGPRWQPIELNDRHLWSHGKVGDCEQSTNAGEGFIVIGFFCCRDKPNNKTYLTLVTY